MGAPQSSIVFAVLWTCICAQRPFYASSNNHYPSVLPQNLPNNSDLGNRLGENSTPDPFLGSEKQPVYNVEKELVDRIKNEYPSNKQPFWYVNAAQLNSIRYQQQPVGQQPEQSVVQQPEQSVVQPAVQSAGQPMVRPTSRAVQPNNDFASRRQQAFIQQQQQQQQQQRRN